MSSKKTRNREAAEKQPQKAVNAKVSAVSSPDRLRIIAALAVIAVITLIAYSNSFSGKFQFDDFHQIVENNFIRKLDIPRLFTDAQTATYELGSKAYRPVTMTSFAVTYAIGGNNTAWFHAGNIKLHILNAFLLFFIFRNIAGRRGYGGLMMPLAAALVFALHPVQTSAVTYISGRAMLLASFFVLAGFYCFIRYREREAGGLLWASSASACFALGLLSKEVGVTLVGLMLLYDLLLAKKPGGWRMKDFFVYAPLPVILALYMLIKQQLAGYSTIISMPMSRLTYFMTELKVFLVYLRVIFLPTGQNADYALLPDPGLGLAKLASVAIIAGAVYLAWKYRKAYPVQAFFGLWFLCVLAPESTIFPITDVAVEYRLYLGIAGLSALAILAIHGMVSSPRFRMAATVAVLALFAVLTLNRNTVWADFYTFWNDVAKKSPYSARAEENLGVSLAMAGNYQDALGHLEKSLKLNPAPEQLDKIYNNLAIIYYRQGMTDMAVQYFQKAAENNPGRPEGYTNLANLYIEQGMYAQAVEVLQKAVKVNPNFAETYLKLTEAYSRMGNTAEAVAAAGNALRCAPMSSTAYHNMAMMDRMAGRIPDAIQYEQKAIDLAANSQELSQAEQGMNMLRGGR